VATRHATEQDREQDRTPEGADPVLTWLYIVIEVLSAIGLVFLILMHSGRGGGLSDMFGGSVGAAASGSTVVERNLDRITVTVAIVFALATLTLDLRLQ
jgi:preprotein translocase subunit SecG